MKHLEYMQKMSKQWLCYKHVYVRNIRLSNM
jgi:hypothetical protein